MPADLNVLVYEFLSAGGEVPGLAAAERAELLAQGQAMRDAMLQDLRAVPGVQASAWAGKGDLATALAQAARQGQRIWAVAPETDGVLEALARAVPAARWLGCDVETIELTSSKQATVRHLAAHGIAVPGGNEAPAWVVKPDDGAGATATRRHATLAAAQADARSRAGRCVVEPWIAGEPLSLSLACGGGRAQVLAINRQHIVIDADGSVHFHGVSPAALPLEGPQGQAMASLVDALARALPGLGGYVGVDLVWAPDDRPVVIEVNPRPTSAYVGLSARLGFNVAQRVLAMAGAL